MEPQLTRADDPQLISVPGTVIAKEPAGTIGTTISGILVAIILILKGSGIELAEEMTTGITALILVVSSIPAVAGWLTRFFVVSPTTAAEASNKSAETGIAVDVMK